MVSIAGNSLLNLGVAIAQEAGIYQPLVLTTTAGSNTQMISSSAIDTEAPTERHGGKYVYSHGPSVIREQARVAKSGFTGTTGTFAFASPYSTSPASGTTASLLDWPWIDQDGLTGIRTCINRALRKLWIRYRYPITSTGPEVNTFDLGQLWWASRDRFIRLWEPDPGSSGHSSPSGVGWSVVQNGEVWTLELGSGFPTGDIFFLEVEAPANSRLYSGQTTNWSQSTSPVAGLGIDSDACLGEFMTVFHCCLLELYRAMSVQAGGTRKSYWQDRLEEQRKIVGAIKAYQMDGDDWVPNSGQSVSPGSWGNVVGDKGMWSRW